MSKRTTDFGELQDDENFKKTVWNFEENLDKIDESLSTVVETFKNFDELTTEEKVKIDNYLAYGINSLYWMYVKLQGGDVNEHGIKNELSRVRQAILRDKQIYERKTLRPVLDKAAAGRFIKHGLHIKFGNDEESNADSEENKMTKENHVDDENKMETNQENT